MKNTFPSTDKGRESDETVREIENTSPALPDGAVRPWFTRIRPSAPSGAVWWAG